MTKRGSDARIEVATGTDQLSSEDLVGDLASDV